MRRLSCLMSSPLAFAAALWACSGGGSGLRGPAPMPSPTPRQQLIQHVIVIFQENRTPDNLFMVCPAQTLRTAA